MRLVMTVIGCERMPTMTRLGSYVHFRQRIGQMPSENNRRPLSIHPFLRMTGHS